MSYSIKNLREVEDSADDIAEIKPLDAIRVSPQVARAFEAGSDGLELVAFGPRHEGDGEILKEDFWS